MLIKYGILQNNIDVTGICYDKLYKNNIIYISENDHMRASIFGDPLPGILKSIFIINDLGEISEYTDKQNIYIDVISNKVTIDDCSDAENKLTNIHKNLKIHFGSFNDEYPEQIMAAKYLTGNEKVLEIGGNIGRNSLVIGYILNQNNNNNFVSLECSREISLQLTNNRDINNLDFKIEASALSKRTLIQRGWDTIESEILLDGYTQVKTITLDELHSKYNIDFDTLILDCEGAFYYILMDMPEILKNIKLIIMENDYWDINKKMYVDNILKNNGFYLDYSRSGGWGPCYNNFYEVWKNKYI
jgi:FkbM family methyltransferase